MNRSNAVTSPPTLLYVCGAFPLTSETFVYREVRALRADGWRVVVASLHDPSARPDALADLWDDRLTVYGRGRRTGNVTAFVREALTRPLRTLWTLGLATLDAISPGEPTSATSRLKLLAQAAAAVALVGRLRAGAGPSTAFTPDHLHAHFAHAPATLAMYAARQLARPFSFTGHANDLFQRRCLLRRKLGQAAFVACISEWHRALYRSVVPRADEAYPVIRCGVPTSRDPRPSPEADGTFRVLTVCRLVEKKGVDTLLRALATLDAPWRLTVAGDGPLASQGRALAASLRIDERVTWLGSVENERVASLLNSCDVFALPCRVDAQGDKDGIPVALMEAMAAGVAVVAGDLPAIRELVDHGRTGLLVDGNNTTATAGALRTLREDHALRSRLARTGRTWAEAEFSASVNLLRLKGALIAAAERRDGVDTLSAKPDIGRVVGELATVRS